MPVRALIIAIEEYPASQMSMLEKKLPGVIDQAKNFRAWLEEKWAAENQEETQLIFCSEPKQPDGIGASWGDIVSALEDLEKEGVRSSTGELFIYFVGHGFRFERSMGSLSDILVASDFRNRGNVCLKLDEIVNWLRVHLGPGRHYYFIDACRNVLDRGQITVSDALTWDPKLNNGEATCYVMQSTVSGAPTLVAGPFADSLLAGLKGEGRAKVWAENLSDGMLVRYDSLRAHLKKKLASEQPITSRVDGEDGESDAVFTILSPPPKSTLKVELQNIDADEDVTIRLTRIRNQADIVQSISTQASLHVEPDNYLVEVEALGFVWDPDGQQEVNLFEAEQELVFQATEDVLESFVPSTPLPMDVSYHVEVPEGARMHLRHLESGVETIAEKTGSVSLPSGRYATILKSSSGTTLLSEELELTLTSSGTFGLRVDEESELREEVLTRLDQPGRTPWFSESLGGPVEDPDLNLWLTLLGGGHIVGTHENGRGIIHSKISQFQLHDFSEIPEQGTALYVIGGGEQLRAATGKGPDVDWKTGTSPDDLTQIQEVYFDGAPGPEFLSLQIGDLEPMTFATCLLPNRVTMFVVTIDDDEEPVVSQFILPLGHLIHKMEGAVSNQLQGRSHLRDLKFLAQALRAYRKRRRLVEEFPGSELDELLYAKWLDPVGALLAAYELIRRGSISDHDLAIVAENLTTYFPHLPDAAAIAKLAGKDSKPNGVPLFLDGWLALRKSPHPPAIPAGDLNYRSPLTTWFGAVTEPKQ